MLKDFTTYDSIIPESAEEDAFTLFALNSVCSLEVLRQMFYSAQIEKVSFLSTWRFLRHRDFSWACKSIRVFSANVTLGTLYYYSKPRYIYLRSKIDDIHSVKLLGTRWYVHVAYTANELTALQLNGWHSLERFAACFQSSSETSIFPSSTCIDLLRVILYAFCAAAVCLKYSQRCIGVCTGSSKVCTCFAAAAISNSSSNSAA